MWMQARTFDVNSSRVYNTRRKSPATRGGALLFFLSFFFLFFFIFFLFLPSEDVNFYSLSGVIYAHPVEKISANIALFHPFLLFLSFFSSSISFFSFSFFLFRFFKNRIFEESLIHFPSFLEKILA